MFEHMSLLSLSLDLPVTRVSCCLLGVLMCLYSKISMPVVLMWPLGLDTAVLFVDATAVHVLRFCRSEYS
jgi:hypothetical protein